MSSQYWPEISSSLKQIDDVKALISKDTVTVAVVESAREKITLLLEQLKSSLEKQTDQNSASLILFSLIAVVDEELQRYLIDNTKLTWPPLQKDFYGAYNAGEIFFKSVDDSLDDPKVPSIVFEIFYFVLKRGFQGKYKDSKTQINKYLDMLKSKISVATVAKIDERDAAPKAIKKHRFKKWHYYTAASLLFAFTYLGLYLTSNAG